MFAAPFFFDFPTASQEASQDVVTTTVRQSKELSQGIVPTTTALIHRASRNGSFATGQCDLYGKQWDFTSLVGFITDLEEDQQDEVWIGTLNDGTGTMNFRYEVKLDYGDIYKADLILMKPGSSQKPVQMIGVPQIMEHELIFMASFMRPCTAAEYVTTHYLEVAEQSLRLAVTQEPAGKATLKAPTIAAPGKDPYNGEEIEIPDADIADLVGKNRLSRIIWKFVNTECKSNQTDSVMLSSIKTFCHTKWTDDEIVRKVEELEEAGVFVFLDASKSRVAPVDT